MSTYTYTPLLGITSNCDVSNRLTFYIYDTFSRLSQMLDQDKNVIKKICYDFSGQVENCQ